MHESLVDCPEVPLCVPVIFHREASEVFVSQVTTKKKVRLYLSGSERFFMMAV